MTVGERIKEARLRLKMSRPALAKAADLPYPTLAGIENSDQSSSTKLHVLAKALRVRVEWLETGKGPMEASDEPPAEEGWADIIGVRQAAALGDGAVVDEYAETHKLKFRAESLRRKKLHAERLAVLYGRGDSMAPTIKNGDAILFDTSDIEPRDDKIYVISYEGDLMAKRLVELGGRWFISSDNKDDPKWRKPVAVDETRQFEIHGRVRWIGSWED
ncbi:helix-turn-helix transcriptional regulator [Luteibacter sp. SG786]|uniref:XRE family transcriptional regulator n=1 Tax=Luteibacter sp. SG786 TaxID=2587130 RepID=UPI0014218C1A|nr:helix-turn-helix transcriptional regulator [Luteibacter sp. SG786]NII53556.1 phage repressor protein C with HTH and peptisase S24 domain [Luteibacter sp. SG786]